MKVQCMLLQTNEKQNNTTRQKKKISQEQCSKILLIKKGGKNINDVKKIKIKRSEMLVHSQLANINICLLSI